MIRFKFTFDKDEEQDWLNGYCQQGWAMSSFFIGVTTFVPCQPGEYIYQIDLLPGCGLRADDYAGYVAFMEETGVEVLQRWGRWVYLRKRAEDGPFNIYTDIDSQIALYRRIQKMFLWVLALDTCLFFSGIWNGVRSGDLVIRSAAAVLVLMLLAMLRAVWRCSWKIQELERRQR